MSGDASITVRTRTLLDTLDDLDGHQGPLFSLHREALADLAKTVLDDAANKPVVERVRALARAERALHFLTTAHGQRVGPHATCLAIADRCAREGYIAMLRAARRLGVRAKPEDPVPAPLVLTEPSDSPVTYTRGTDSLVPSFLSRQHRLPLGFPLILVPANVLGGVWMLTTLQHEVGHDVDEALGVTGELRPILRGDSRLPASHTETWAAWTREIVADLLAYCFAGAGFYLTLHDWLTAFGLDGHDSGGSHPVPRARLALGYEILRSLGHAAPNLPKAEGKDEWQGDVAAVVRTVLDTPLDTLNGARLRDLAPPAANPELDAVITDLEQGREGWRLLPSAAQLAVHAEPQRASEIQERVVRLKPLDDPSIMPLRQARFHERVVPQLLAPILEDEQVGRKVPPAQLLARHDSIAFVGATNGQLADALGAWRAKHAGKKAVVEVFFLRPDLLEGLVTSERPLAKLTNEAAEARRRLGTLLPDIASRWAIYEFREPYYFASYWDADRPGGRIHVSSLIWGLEVREAPAIDYEWPRTASAPGLEYERYRRGLGNLRARSIPIAASNP